MRVRFCQDDFELPSGDFQRLRPSDYERDGLNSLRQRLEEDGYLYLKGFLDRDDVLRARQAILNYMDAHEGLEPGSRPLDGVMGVSGKSVRMAGQRPVTHDPAVRAVLESSRLFDFYQQLYGGPVKTFDYKWMRAVGNDEATGCHMDHVYMGRGSKRVMTCWVPFDDIPIERGTLAVCPGSHAAAAFARLRETYGQMDIDRDRISDGWFSKHPREMIEQFGSQWLTDDVEAGDIISFGMHLMHASTTNTTDRWRLSCDIRFQPAEDVMDDRWVGEQPAGHVPLDGTETTMKEARAVWGL